MYTAVTRAKCNLWIYDSDKKKRAPIFDYWHKRGLVEVVGKNVEGKSQDSLMFASISTTQDWKVQGDSFKKRHQWEHAKHCYEKAGAENELLAKEAHARLLVKQARLDNTPQTSQLYLRAAVLFLEVEHVYCNPIYISYAASCLTKTRPPRYTDAAKLFEKLGEDKQAFSAYWKVEDAENCVRLNEKAGRYTEAVKTLDHFNGKIEALAKAVEYKKQGIQVDLKVSSDLAYLCAKHYAKLKEKDSLLKVVKYITEIPKQVRVLKEGDLHKNAFEILVKQKCHEEAYRLASAQKWYEEGISLAKEMENFTMMAEFTFQKIKATHFKNADEKIHPEISSTLLYFRKSSDQTVRAHACLLLGKLQRDVKLCREAKETYKSLQHEVGELEAFNAIVELKQETSDHSVPSILDVPSIVDAYILAHTAKDMLHKNNSASAKQTVKLALQFYGLQKISNVYFLPPDQDIWIRTFSNCGCQDKQTDLDGMIRLDASKTKRALVDHCGSFTTKWQSHFELHQQLNSKLKQFKPHIDIYERKFLSCSFRSTEIPLDTYIQTCVSVLELTDLELIPTTDINPNILLLSIFSPQVSIHLQLRESHMAVVRRSKRAHRAIGKWIKSMIYENESEKIKVDSWLTAWRASCITDGEMKPLETSLAEQAKKVIDEAEMVGTQIMQPLPLVYIYCKDKQQFYHHIFHFWLKSCQCIKDGNVFRSSQHAISDFLGNITKQSISIMNLVDILSVHCTALLTMVMCLDIFNHRGQTSVMVPLLYKHAIQVFDDLNNCTKGPSRRILRGCVEEVQKREVKEVQKKEKESKRVRSDCLKLLWAALDVALGHESDQFSPLCMEQEQTLESSEARHLLILALTLFGNLMLIEEEFPKEIAEYQQRFSIFFQTYLHRHQTVKYVEATRKCFESPKLTRETLFPLVQNLLLHSSPKSNATLGNLVLKSNNEIVFKEIPLRSTKKLGEQDHAPRAPPSRSQVPPSMPQPTSYASVAGAAIQTAAQHFDVRDTTSSTHSGPIQKFVSPKVELLTPFTAQQTYELSPHPQPGHDSATFPCNTMQKPNRHMQPPMTVDPAILQQPIPTHEIHQETKHLLLNGDNFAPQDSRPQQPIQEDPPEHQLQYTAIYASTAMQQNKVGQQSKVGVLGAPDDVHLHITTEPPVKVSQDESESKMDSFNGDDVKSSDGFPNKSSFELMQDKHIQNRKLLAEYDDLNDTLVDNLTGKDAEDSIIGEAIDPSLIDNAFCIPCGILLSDETTSDADESEEQPLTPKVEIVETHQLHVHMRSQKHKCNEIIYKKFHEDLHWLSDLMQDLDKMLKQCEELNFPSLIDDMTEEKENDEKKIEDFQNRYAWREGIQEMEEMADRIQTLLHKAQTECNKYKLKQPVVEPAEVEVTLNDTTMMEKELASEAPLRSKEKKEHSREAKRQRKKGRDKKAA